MVFAFSLPPNPDPQMRDRLFAAAIDMLDPNNVIARPGKYVLGNGIAILGVLIGIAVRPHGNARSPIAKIPRFTAGVAKRPHLECNGLTGRDIHRRKEGRMNRRREFLGIETSLSRSTGRGRKMIVIGGSS